MDVDKLLEGLLGTGPFEPSMENLMGLTRRHSRFDLLNDGLHSTLVGRADADFATQ
jgi:hypothetical protein